MSDGGATLILGGDVRDAMAFARRHAIVTAVAVTHIEQLRGHAGARLIVLEDCYASRPHWYEYLVVARKSGLRIEYRRCDE